MPVCNNEFNDGGIDRADQTNPSVKKFIIYFERVS